MSKREMYRTSDSHGDSAIEDSINKCTNLKFTDEKSLVVGLFEKEPRALLLRRELSRRKEKG